MLPPPPGLLSMTKLCLSRSEFLSDGARDDVCRAASGEGDDHAPASMDSPSAPRITCDAPHASAAAAIKAVLRVIRSLRFIALSS